MSTALTNSRLTHSNRPSRPHPVSHKWAAPNDSSEQCLLPQKCGDKMPTKCEDTHSSAFKYLWPIEAGHAGKLAIKVKTTDRQQFGNVGGGVVVCGGWQHAEWRVICGAGRLQWLGIGGRLHTLRSGYVPCLLASQPPPPVRGGGGRESFDYFHRLRLIPAKGHCSLWAAQTKRLPANNTQDGAFKKNITHRPPITKSLIVATAVPFLSEVTVER